MAAKKNGRQATRGGNGTQKPAWLWVLVGMLLGIGLMLVVLGKDWAPLLRKKNLPQPNPEATAPRESEPPLAEAKPPPKKNYDFYQVLPEAEVVIPDAELSAKAKAEKQAQQARANPTAPATTPGATPGTPAAPAAGARYVLQTSSYPDPKAADEAKAKLALSGFSAQVQPVTINGKTWHRVRLGPYSSASELEAAKKSLAENGINAIALKEQPAQ
ncbi:SPOR domain-containing protein [Dokdonella sp.]|uniref:SPOR domain-containing protein n=1 Tax=Dokdonella sp. TaxID=2291710 RepID=UPI001B2A9EF1|nr:SPOR domain-containing protein [Dokdonella sp.]MBO9661290.1 SPOR domain-containing protein [Dokdonella sp.]